jgi:ubiquinone/menaquinone biosynthesis C-methylase UbiE
MSNEKKGFLGNQEDMLKIWRRYASNWKTRSSPWRVSKGDIQIYKNILEKELPGKILILGSTPELRDLVSSTGNKVTLIDICPEMIISMGSLLKKSKVSEEMHILADWRSMPFLDNSFDIILGEYIWLLFSTKDQTVLIKELSRILKPKGVMLSRSHFCDTSYIGKNLEQLVEENLPPHKSSDEEKRAQREILLSRILDASTNLKTERQDAHKATKIVKKMMDKEKYLKHLPFLNDLYSSLEGRTNWSSNTRKQLEQRLSKSFIIEQEITSEDYADSVFFPVLKLRKK